MFFRIHAFQGSGFSESRFFRVQVFQSPSFSGSWFFRVQVFQGPGSGPGFRSSQTSPCEIKKLTLFFYRKT